MGGIASLPWLAALGLLAAGCSMDELLGTDKLPPDVTDPEITQTAEGARAAYHGTLAGFGEAFGVGVFSSFTAVTGVLTDELEWGVAQTNDIGTASPSMAADMRDLPEGEEGSLPTEQTYSNLQRVRGQAGQAIGLLTRYAPGSEALVGHVYAIQGYAEIFLADLFCSGIPLSTLDFEGDFTYRPGSTTGEVYTHAAELLDTALTLAADSTRFAHLARVGKARALLALGRFGDAAAAVADVPDDYRYSLGYSATAERWASFARVGGGSPAWSITVGDREGGNGMDYATSGDPRTAVAATWGVNDREVPIRHPSKYATDGSSPIVLASGIEARLIEAEAALHAGDAAAWLEKLNHLRRTAWTTIEPAVAGPLPDLADPGSDAARIDLLFRERAFWLFLTGHRQGDLRRLIRQYGRSQAEVYPVGPYHVPNIPGLGYGGDVDAPVPPQERIYNPHYTGCISRGA